MPKLYQKGNSRYYADLRDLGLGQHALRPPGSTRATQNQSDALVLMGKLIERLQRDGKGAKGPSDALGLAVDEFVRRNPGEVTEGWRREHDHKLGRARRWFGEERPLASIKPKDVRAWWDQLESKGLASGTIRHHLNALSALYRWAIQEELVPPSHNPVGMLYRKPSTSNGRVETKRAKFLEIDEAARFLETARTRHRAKRRWLLDGFYELVATFLLTGGRKAEVLGLLVGDVDLDGGHVNVRPNQHRPLKNQNAERTIPLWPQLEEILIPWMEGREPRDLLFAGPTGGMIKDLRKALRATSEVSDVTVKGVTIFRHTYATARLQTTDNGKQIALWTVAKELGHKGVGRVEDTYGHPSHYHQRGEVVEYRVLLGFK